MIVHGENSAAVMPDKAYREKCEDYIRLVQSALGLSEWTIRLNIEFSTQDATVDTDLRYKTATLTLPECLSDEAIKGRVIHEVLHVLFSGMSHAMIRAVGEESPYYEYHTDGEEHAVKVLEKLLGARFNLG